MTARQKKANPPPDEHDRERELCSNGADGAIYFIRTYCKIFDESQPEKDWFPFALWPEQEEVIRKFFESDKLIVLKARQLGLSWLFIALQLWYLEFRPGSATTIFSMTDREAVALFRDRMKEMHKRLPVWLRSASDSPDNDHSWRLTNGSMARCFPTTAGDSYTTTFALIDEADKVPNLDELLLAVEPTISAGGKLVLISKAFKKRPNSGFKKIFRAALQSLNAYVAIFLPWHVRPSRTPEWYEAQKKDSLENSGSLDNLHENYPATPEEALAPRTLDKRIPSEWLRNCLDTEAQQIHPEGAPAIPGLRIYEAVEAGASYVIGADPAEGNPTSDDSALSVKKLGAKFEQVAVLAGKFEPGTFGGHISAISLYYNKAAALVERNNHGHAVLLWLRDHALHVSRLSGEDNKKGWLSSTKGKTVMYDKAAEMAQNEEIVIRDMETYLQLASIDGSTLRAPEGDRDDLADADVLANLAALRKPSFGIRDLR